MNADQKKLFDAEWSVGGVRGTVTLTRPRSAVSIVASLRRAIGRMLAR